MGTALSSLNEYGGLDGEVRPIKGKPSSNEHNKSNYFAIKTGKVTLVNYRIIVESHFSCYFDGINLVVYVLHISLFSLSITIIS